MLGPAGRGDRAALERVNSTPFPKPLCRLVFDRHACTMQRKYYTKLWCVVLCNRCVAHTFLFCICQPQHTQMWTRTAEPAVPPCVSLESWLDFFSDVLGTFSFHLFPLWLQAQAIFYKVVSGFFFFFPECKSKIIFHTKRQLLSWAAILFKPALLSPYCLWRLSSETK